jgi:hypothetical protein
MAMKMILGWLVMYQIKTMKNRGIITMSVMKWEVWDFTFPVTCLEKHVEQACVSLDRFLHFRPTVCVSFLPSVTVETITVILSFSWLIHFITTRSVASNNCHTGMHVKEYYVTLKHPFWYLWHSSTSLFNMVTHDLLMVLHFLVLTQKKHM